MILNEDSEVLGSDMRNGNVHTFLCLQDLIGLHTTLYVILMQRTYTGTSYEVSNII